MGIFNVGGRTFHPGDQGARLVHCQRLILGLAWEKGSGTNCQMARRVLYSKPLESWIAEKIFIRRGVAFGHSGTPDPASNGGDLSSPSGPVPVEARLISYNDKPLRPRPLPRFCSPLASKNGGGAMIYTSRGQELGCKCRAIVPSPPAIDFPTGQFFHGGEGQGEGGFYICSSASFDNKPVSPLIRPSATFSPRSRGRRDM